VAGYVFISYSRADRAYVERLASRLAQASISVWYDVDVETGEPFSQKIQQAIDDCAAFVVVLTPAAVASEWVRREISRAVRKGKPACPVLRASCDPPIEMDGVQQEDVSGGQMPTARFVTRLREMCASATTTADTTTMSSSPSAVPTVWNVPIRSAVFTGREDLLARLRESLLAGHTTVVHALHGLGGVGKTMLALEYAHRYAGEYELVWWVNAEQPDLVGEQLAGLAVGAGVVDAGADTPTALDAARSLLRRRGRWLVVFDNAPSAADVVEWVPHGPGHVLITSRSHVWGGLAVPIAVDVFTRAESVALLLAQVPDLGEADADRLAEALGDLPLALAQACGVMTETGMPVDEYLDLLGSHAGAVMAAGAPVGYPSSLAATVRVAATRLGGEDPAAARLLELLALLGPEPVPLWLFDATTRVLEDPLAGVAADTLALRRCVGRLRRYGLVQVGAETVVMHRLTQAIIRDDLGPAGREAGRATAEALLVAARPNDGTGPPWSPRWVQLMPHILATDPATASNAEMQDLACDALWHMRSRGAARAALPIAEQLYQAWRGRYGEDASCVLRAATNLGAIYAVSGRYQLAREVDEATLARYRRTLGADHPDTLRSAHNLASDLLRIGQIQQALEADEDARFEHVAGDDHPDTVGGATVLAKDVLAVEEIEKALHLDEDTLARRRRVLGDDHPETLRSAHHLAVDLWWLGRHDQARALAEDAQARRRRVLGDDHPDTLQVSSDIAVDLRLSGLVEQARQMDEDTLARLRRLLGHDHRDSLRSAHNLAIDLRALGLVEQARQMDQDTLARRRRLLGHDHRDTLRSAHNLAIDLRALGLVEQARHLDQDLLTPSRAVPGEE
jgi:tetratricopeptide (TPR) repeat protein